MAEYQYTAKTRSGEQVSGRVEAANLKSVLAEIDRLGYFPLSVDQPSEKTERTFSLPWNRGRISSSTLAMFYRQLADLLDGGVTVLYALEVLKEQYQKGALHTVIESLTADLADGSKMSDAMRRHERYISSLDVSLIAAGEAGGNLEQCLMRLADLKERDYELRSKVRATLAYPSMLLLASFAVLTAFMVFVVPNIVVLYEELGQELPIATRIVIGASQIITRYGWMPALLIVTALYTKQPKILFESIDKWTAYMSVRLPIIKEIFVNTDISTFTQTLDSLLRSGLPILTAWDISCAAVQNRVLRQSLSSLKANIEQGQKIGPSLRSNHLLPHTFSSIVAVGEESNRLEDALAKAGEIYQRQADNSARLLTSILEPAMILVIGIVVASIILSMILPIFQIDLGGA